MSLLEKIRADALAARKARDTVKATFLVTLLAEAEKRGKDKGNRASTDEEVVAVVKSFIENLEKSIEALWTPDKLDTDKARVARRHALMLELSYAGDYMPAQVTDAEVHAAVQELLAGLAPEKRNPKSMGPMMAELTTMFGTGLNKKIASDMVRAALTAKA